MQGSVPDSDEPGAVRAGREASGQRSGIGVEDGAKRAQAMDGAGGGPAEERTWARGTRRGLAQDRGVPDSDERTG